MKKYAVIVLLIFTAIVIGFAMENIKVNINFILERGGAIPTFFDQDAQTKQSWLDGNRVLTPYDYYYSHKRINLLFNVSQSNLVKLKWVNSVLFTVIFMSINALLMKKITGNSQFARWTIILYAIFFVLSFLIYAFGKFSGTLEHAYAVSRKITGALQSLVPLMILVPASWLIRNVKFDANATH